MMRDRRGLATLLMLGCQSQVVGRDCRGLPCWREHEGKERPPGCWHVPTGKYPEGDATIALTESTQQGTGAPNRQACRPDEDNATPRSPSPAQSSNSRVSRLQRLPEPSEDGARRPRVAASAGVHCHAQRSNARHRWQHLLDAVASPLGLTPEAPPESSDHLGAPANNLEVTTNTSTTPNTTTNTTAHHHRPCTRPGVPRHRARENRDSPIETPGVAEPASPHWASAPRPLVRPYRSQALRLRIRNGRHPLSSRRRRPPRLSHLELLSLLHRALPSFHPEAPSKATPWTTNRRRPGTARRIETLR